MGMKFWFYVMRLLVLVGVVVLFLRLFFSEDFSSHTSVAMVWLFGAIFSFYFLFDNVRYLLKIYKENRQ